MKKLKKRSCAEEIVRSHVRRLIEGGPGSGHFGHSGGEGGPGNPGGSTGEGGSSGSGGGNVLKKPSGSRGKAHLNANKISDDSKRVYAGGWAENFINHMGVPVESGMDQAVEMIMKEVGATGRGWIPVLKAALREKAKWFEGFK